MSDYSLTRELFVERYIDVINELFCISENGSLNIKKNSSWRNLTLSDMTLLGIFTEVDIYNQVIENISQATNPTKLIFTEIESIQKYTEVILTPVDRRLVEGLLYNSTLPLLNTICFDETASWCILYDNNRDSVFIHWKPQQ